MKTKLVQLCAHGSKVYEMNVTASCLNSAAQLSVIWRELRGLTRKLVSPISMPFSENGGKRMKSRARFDKCGTNEASPRRIFDIDSESGRTSSVKKSVSSSWEPRQLPCLPASLPRGPATWMRPDCIQQVCVLWCPDRLWPASKYLANLFVKLPISRTENWQSNRIRSSDCRCDNKQTTFCPAKYLKSWKNHFEWLEMRKERFFLLLSFYL